MKRVVILCMGLCLLLAFGYVAALLLGELSVAVRIDDKDNTPEYSDRVNQRILLKPGMNHVVLPFDSLRTPSGRLLDVRHIYAFMMFMVRPPRETVLYLDHVRLEKAETEL